MRERDDPRDFHGRRSGHALRPRQRALLDTLLPRLAVDLDAPAPRAARDLFAAPLEGLRLEIGFGGGEHLIAEARRRPETGFIGCEPFVNGMAKTLAAIEDENLANIRLHAGTADALLDWLAPASLDGVDLLYPDPWPKARHHKRRFVRAANLDRLARALKPGRELRFASDWPDYVGWTLQRVRAHGAFEWTARRADDWRRPWPPWPGTRYEAKALREGRRPTYLTFRRR